MENSLRTDRVECLTDEAKKIGDKLGANAAGLKSKVSDLSREAREKIDNNLGAAASGLDRAAEKLHRKADDLPGTARLSGLTHAAADKLNATAGYFREHDVNRIGSDLSSMVRQNPGRSLLAVGVIGFLIGRAFNDRRA
jgi:hypothetical protein